MRLFIIAFALLSFGTCFSKTVSKNDARCRAEAFLSKDVIENGEIQAKRSVLTGDTRKAPGYYVFNAADGNGFVVISADDCTRPILAYSKSGTLSGESMPPQLLGLLEQYESEVMDARQSVAAPVLRAKDTHVPEKVLETAHFHQTYPYNAKCPIIGGQHAPAGCAATAMAIVMQYHQWPPANVGTWYWDADLNKVEHDFNTKFDWDNILNDYSGAESEEQIDAVASLVSEAGISLGTVYGQSESEAYASLFGCFALVDRLRYHAMCRQIEWYHTINGENGEPFYSYDEWTGIMKSEIDAGRPLIYMAATQDFSGHTFVCDGYDGDGLFHFNFGWGGSGDGFYAVTALLPDESGVSAYPKDHRMIIGIQPEESDSEAASMVYINSKAAGAGLHISVSEVKENMPFVITLGNLAYRDGDPDDYAIGCALTDSEGKILQVINRDNFGEAVFTVPVKPDYMLEAVSRKNDSSTDNWVVIPGWDGNNRCPAVDHDSERPLHLKVDGQTLVLVEGLNKTYYNSDATVNVRIGQSYNIYLLCPDINSNYHLVINGEKQTNYGYAGVGSVVDGYYMVGTLVPDNRPANEVTVSRVPHKSLTHERIICAQEGALFTLLEDKDLDKIGVLQVSGQINNDDFKYALENLPNLYKFDAFEAKYDEAKYPGHLWGFSSSWSLTNATLQSLWLPAGMVNVGYFSFNNLYRLSEICLPSSIEDVSGFAFKSDLLLHRWYCFNPEPPVVSDISLFESTPFYDATLYVPVGSRDKYLSVMPWMKFKEIVECEPAGIFDVTEDMDASDIVKIYSIQGVLEYIGKTVDEANLKSGVHIMLRGSKVAKIYIP